MPLLPGWRLPTSGRRRRTVRAVVTSYLPAYLPAPARRAASSAFAASSLLTRVGLWLAIGLLVALFGLATNPSRVAVIAVPASVVALLWYQLSSPLRVVIVAGLGWLSIVELGMALGLGLVALLVAWWWLPHQIGDRDLPPPAGDEPEQEPDLASMVAPTPGGARPYDFSFSGHVSASLRRFAEERHLREEEVTMLASIRFPGEPPRTTARWHHIYNAIHASRWLDKEGV
jgi:hypothetical protein